MLFHVPVKKLEELPDLTSAETIILDYETTSGDPQHAEADPWRGARIALISISNCVTTWTIATDRCKRSTAFQPVLPTESVLTWLRASLAQKRQAIIGHWIRAEANLSRADNCDLNKETMWYCTEIGLHHAQDTLTEFGLKESSRVLCGYEEDSRLEGLLKTWLADSRIGTRSRPGDYAEVPTDLLAQYGAADIEATHRIYQWIESCIDDQQRECMHQDFEVNKIFHDMQYQGVFVDPMRLLLSRIWCIQELQAYGALISDLLGREINPMSGDHLESVLIKEFGLPVLAYTDSEESRKPSFDGETMERYIQLLQNKQVPKTLALISFISAYRDAMKMHGFLEQYFQNVSESSDKRLHGNIHPCRARGGRTTSDSPNLQNMPPLCKLLIRAEAGRGLFNIDASQIEYRMMAHYEKDPRLIEGYKSREFDLHKYVQDWLHLSRRAAKIINFGIAFNMGETRLAHDLSSLSLTGDSPRVISFEEARSVLREYFNLLPQLLPTRRAMMHAACERGYVRNYFGRKSHLDRRNGYKAFNRIMQGGSADLVKNRMIAIDSALRKHGLHGIVNWQLMIHDELLFDMPTDPAVTHRALPLVIHTLENFDKLRLPFYWEGAWSTIDWWEAAKAKDDKKLKGAPVGDVLVKSYETIPASTNETYFALAGAC